MVPSSPLVELRGVGLVVERPARVQILSGIDLAIAAGSVTSIIGPSGAGKSSLASIIGALQPASEGSYLFQRQEIAGLSARQLARFRAKNLGFVFQNAHMIEQRTALGNVDLGVVEDNVPKLERRERAMDALSRVGLGSLADRRVAAMSGGERHRVAIARALVKDPVLLIADEPTASLDQVTGERILELLASVVRDVCTLVVVTHDQRAADMADAVVEIVDGAVRRSA